MLVGYGTKSIFGKGIKMQNLSKEQKELTELAIEALKKKNALAFPCPSCGDIGGALSCCAMRVVILPFPNPLEEMHLQFLMRTCQKCGRTDFYNLGVLGLVQNPT
jgi:predicted RNA-binding Zn-ribbon protein involved in translation (DUF1610 family)